MDDPQHKDEVSSQLRDQLLLWHTHRGWRGHTHRRGDVSHVHRVEKGPDGTAVPLTVWEDGEVE